MDGEHGVFLGAYSAAARAVVVPAVRWKVEMQGKVRYYLDVID